MKHAELIVHAAKWVRKRRYRVVLQDVQATCVNEQPDVIAWKGNGSSIVIECKVSRSDFLRDAKKRWRYRAEDGMGYHRYYAVPDGPLAALDRQAGWGLLVVKSGGRIVEAYPSGPFTKRNERAERALLISAVCRVTDGWGRKIFGAHAPQAPDGDPAPSTARVIRELREENRRLRARSRSERTYEDGYADGQRAMVDGGGP